MPSSPWGVHRRYLRDDLVLNDLARTAVVIHREALSRETGRAHFRAHHFGNSPAPGGPVTMLEFGKVCVPVRDTSGSLDRGDLDPRYRRRPSRQNR